MQILMAFYYVFLAIFMTEIAMATMAAKVPAIYVLGDSTVDVGNNDYLSGKEAPKANFPHYGIDFINSDPTGRFCNGLMGIDYTAKKLGFKLSPLPFLSRKMYDVEFQRGVNFASAGSGILNSTGQDIIPLDEQIRNFASVVQHLKKRRGKKEANKSLEKSLFYFSTGNNDLFAVYNFTNPPNSTRKDEIVTLLINKYKEQIKEVYYLGARRFAIVGTGLVGCIPMLRALTPSNECIDDLNELSRRFQFAMNDMIKDLSLKLEGFNYSFGNAYNFGLQVFNHPSRYGFTELKSACCGQGKLKAEVMCAPNTTYCNNRRQHFYWDRFHPTQALLKLIAKVFYSGKKFTNPVNIRNLVRG